MLKHVLERSTKSGMSGASGLMGKMMGMGTNDSSDERTTMEVTELKRGESDQIHVTLGVEFTPELIEIVDDFFFRQSIQGKSGSAAGK